MAAARDHEAVVQCKINQTTDHYWSTVFCSSSAFGHYLLTGGEARGDLLHSAGDHGAGHYTLPA